MAFIRMWSPINQQLILRFINANIVIIYDLSPKLCRIVCKLSIL